MTLVRIALLDTINAQLRAPWSRDLQDRLNSYHGVRWVPQRRQSQVTGKGYWSIPARHLRDVEAELRGAGYEVVVTRSEPEGVA